MIKAVIIDDEENSRTSLRGKLELFCPEVEIVAEAASVSEALETLNNHKPDVIFLDIQLGSESGFDVLEKIDKEEVNSEVIFITAHDEFAIQAIKFSALDYLLKPIDSEELVKAIRRVEERKGLQQSDVSLQVLVENLRQSSDSSKKIVVPTSDGMHVIKVAKIIRLESSSNYTVFHIKDEKSLLASRTLKEFDTILQDYNFQRIHKSHLINMNYIKRYVQTDGGYIILEDGAQIPVANRKKDQLMEWLKNM